MIKTTLLCFTVLMTSIAFAQQSEKTETPLTRDIGFNTTFLFQDLFSAGYTPFSLMLKTYSREGRATRYGADLSFHINKEDDEGQTSGYYYNSTNIYASFSIGKEKQLPIHETRWVWFYGADIAPFIRIDNYETFQNNDLQNTRDHQQYGVGIHPLLGIRYNINRKVYISAEGNLNLSYAFSKRFEKQFDPETIHRDSKGSNITFNVSPAYGLFLYYRF